jgi:hypothetical protein
MFEPEETMKYLLLILLLISTVTLFAQAMPRPILVKLLTEDGSTLSPSDIFVRAYFQERPEEIQTSITRPKHFNATLLNSRHQGFYLMLNPSAFHLSWETGETLIADITQVSTGNTARFTLQMPTGTNVIWVEDPITLIHSIPNLASSPVPKNRSANISSTTTTLGWSFIQAKGYSRPIAFRLAIDTDSLFSNATVLYVKNTNKNPMNKMLPKKILPLKSNTTYYWKVIPTVSTSEDISLSSLRPILIDGKPIKTQRSGDADQVSVWRFTTGE